MSGWKELPEELDPEVKEFTRHMRRAVERGELSVSAVAERTGYSRSSWERYLNGRLLPPREAVVALAEVTRTDPGRLTVMWELAEQAWDGGGQSLDAVVEAAGGEEPPPEEEPGAVPGGKRRIRGYFGLGPGGGDTGEPADPERTTQLRHLPDPARPRERRERREPREPRVRPPQTPPLDEPFHPSPGEPPDEPQEPEPAGRGRPARRVGLAALVSLLIGGSLAGASWVGYGLVTDQDDKEPRGGGGGHSAIESPSTSPSGPSPSSDSLPEGVKCSGEQCAGKDPDAMGCGGEYATSTAEAYVGTAFVEVRVSSACKAAWARIIEADAGSSVTAVAEVPGQEAVRERAEVTGTEAYTPMVVVDDLDAVRACAELPSGVEGCTAE